ncbi:WYL domain-containing protein, partial [Actinomadura adrarensis]
LDRLAEPSGTGARFRPRELPAEDAADFVRASIHGLFSVHDVEVLMDAPAADVRARIGRWTTVEDAGPHQCRVLMTVESLDWAASALITAEADFRVVSPPEFRDHLRESGRRFARAAND